MRSNRSLTQPETSASTKKLSSSSGDADQQSSSTSQSVATTPAPVKRPGSASMDRAGEALHNIQKEAASLICNPLRKVVSQNRRRFQSDGFDLDLTYITDRIIAMGYPAGTTEALYRNSMTDTRKFLEKYHSGHYKVFNLRGLFVYDANKFHNRVMSFEMTDHHPPRLELMAPFCRAVHDWLSADEKNIVAVHCKAGKGRTGVMICAYLCYINFYLSPRQNMDYYSIVRTKNNKGVTIPSQRRYVYYYSHLRKRNFNYMPLRVELVGVFFERPPLKSATSVRSALGVGLNSKEGYSLRVANGDVDVFLGDAIPIVGEDWNAEERAWLGNVANGPDSCDPSHPVEGEVVSRRAFGWMVPKDKRVFLEGDIRVDIYFSCDKKFLMKKEKSKLGHIWFNTMFACPGFCGGAFQHGDEAHPYPEGATTISERKSQAIRSKTGSTSLPSSPPVADAASRNSEPHIDRNAEERINHKPPKKTSVLGKSKERSTSVWSDEMELVLPPGLNRHAPEEYLKAIYGERTPPRYAIENMLRAAHQNNLIEDSYNKRRLSVPQEGNPIPTAPEGRPSDRGGPYCVRLQRGEHVQIYPLLEVDRACKNTSYDPGFKIFIITKCVPPEKPEDVKLAESFMRCTYEKQGKIDEENKEKVQKRLQKLQNQPSESVCEPEPCTSGSSDPRRSDPHLSKFFHRQRLDSLSIYPAISYKCPLLHNLESEVPVPAVDVSASPSAVPVPPSGVYEVKTTDWDDKDVEDLTDLDKEVRSYHPVPVASTESGGSSIDSSDSDTVLPHYSAEDPSPSGMECASTSQSHASETGRSTDEMSVDDASNATKE